MSTKLYNKTLELRQGEDKPYIRQAWETAGLNTSQDVWRVEFSLSAQMQTLKSLKSGEMFKKSIIHYDSRERLLKQFYILAAKYFDFRTLLCNRKSDGKLVYVRKYLCPKLELFRFDSTLVPYKPVRNVTKQKRPDRIYKILINKLSAIIDDDRNSRSTMKAAEEIIAYLCYKMHLDVGDARHKLEDKFLVVERVKQLQEQQPEELVRWHQQDYELRVLHHLMLKYGVTAPPEDAPF